MSSHEPAFSKESTPRHVAILLFDHFETLDVFGPVEILGRLKEHYSIYFYSQQGGVVANQDGVALVTKPLSEVPTHPDLFLIPGGLGTRKEVNNTALIEQIRVLALRSTYVLTVCTGSALLAKTGLLNNRQATTNKGAFAWVSSQGPEVNWDKTARWVIDDKYYTSSGVSAGMDMTLGFINDQLGIAIARQVANRIEYVWQENKNDDRFRVEE